MSDYGPSLTRLTADLVSAYVARNAVPVAAMPDLIRTVHAAIGSLGKSATSTPQAQPLSPAEVKRSITKDGLISFIDGRTYKTLRRHLTAHRMTPDQYRREFGLPDDYPLVAPSYSATRSKIAKAIGLGVPGAMAQAA